MNADGSEQRRLTRNAAPDSYAATELAWSPRGDKIAFVSRRDGNLGIYVMNTDGTGQHRLTRNTVRDGNPVWSPDGRRIAFESNWQVYVMNADGSGQQRLTRNEGLNLRPAWSPDGQTIAFERTAVRRRRPIAILRGFDSRRLHLRLKRADLAVSPGRIRPPVAIRATEEMTHGIVRNEKHERKRE
jgi:Tol biopolymer transport system component